MKRISIPNEKANEKNNSDLELYYFGTQQCKPGDSWGPNKKDHYKLHYVHDGCGQLQSYGKTYTIKKGQMFACFPEEIVYYQADATYPWQYSWVAFDGLNSEQYLTSAGFRRDNLVIECPNKIIIENAFNEILSAEASAANTDLHYIGYLYIILSSIINTSSSEIAMKQSHGYIKEAISYIKANYHTEISIEDISKSLSLDRKYFSKLFKMELNLSPSEYLMQFRISKACELLQTTNMTISEIAVTVGYSNQFSFSRVFKKHLGMSPTDFRKGLPKA
ncbi:MAG: AraC family transcriptional regulator [Lachnospiraceae bacterium]|nr:AraC family transcriptional regulator [Lachnospiraceae bacterium]